MGTTGTVTEEQTLKTADRPGHQVIGMEPPAGWRHSDRRVLIQVDPGDLLEDPEIKKLRQWTAKGSTTQEKDLPTLAQLMYDEGQLVPAIVRQTEEGLVIVDGQRRVEAAKMIRESADPGWLLWVEVQELDDKQAKKVAITATFKRANFTKIELAKIIKGIREQCKEDGVEGSCTEYVADYLGVSPATVTQTEKLLTLPEDVQARIQAGTYSVEAALEVLRSTPEMAEEVKRKAQEKADEREARARKERDEKDEKARKKMEGDKKKGKSSNTKDAKVPPLGFAETPVYKTYAVITGNTITDKPIPPPMSPPPIAKVLRQDVTAAQKDTPGSVPTSKAPKMADAINLFGKMTGYQTVLENFLTTFVKWAHGQLKTGDNGLVAAFDDISDSLAGRKKGTAAAKKRDKSVEKARKPAPSAPASKAKPTGKSGSGSKTKAKKTAKKK